MAFSSDRFKAASLVALVFLLGVAFGAVGVLAGRRVFGAAARTPVDGGQGQLTVLMHQLNLTADQQSKFQQTLAETRERYDQLRREMEPQFQQIREKSRDRIQQILTSEQKSEYEGFLRERRNERSQDNSRRGGANNRNQLTNRNGLSRLTQELHLNAEQQTQLDGILRDTRASLDAVRQQTNPLFEEARLQNRERLREIVNPQQRQVLDDFFQRRDEQRRDDEGRRR
jgi:Spy/CpxP family protein refolding chaperone